MSKTKRITPKELDQAAIDAAIAISPFNPHEKSSAAVHRTVLALMYKEGYRACENHTETMVTELVEALDSVVNNIETGASDECIQRIALDALSKFRGES